MMIFQTKCVLFFLIGVLLSKKSFTQDSTQTSLILKFTPSMLLDLDNTLTLGIEVPLSSLLSVQQEVGWGNSVLNLWDERTRYPNKNNWRFRTQVRYIFSKNKSGVGGWYVAVEYFRKEIFIKQLHGFGRDCNPNTGTCAYFEEGLLQTRRRISALHGKLGYQWAVPDARVVFDFYLGGGYRRLIVTNNNPLGQTNAVWDGFFNFRSLRPGKYEPTVSLSAGFSLGIFLGQKKRKPLPLHS